MTAKAETVSTAVVGRTPPWDREAERAVLGAVMIDVAVLDEVNQLVQSRDFHLEIHRQIFEAMLRLSAERKAIDAVTLPAEMRVVANLDEVEARTYVSGLDSGLASAANAKHYAEIVRGLAVRRMVREAALKIAELSHDESLPVATLRDSAEQLLFTATQETTAKDLVSIGELLRETLRRASRS